MATLLFVITIIPFDCRPETKKAKKNIKGGHCPLNINRKTKIFIMNELHCQRPARKKRNIRISDENKSTPISRFYFISIVTFRETVMSEARHSLFIVHFSYN